MASCKECFHYEVCMDYTILKESEWAQNYPGSDIICDHFKATADVEEVNRGEWEICLDEYGICATEFICTVCLESFVSSELTDKEFLEMMRYCPHCGAKMGGGNT